MTESIIASPNGERPAATAGSHPVAAPLTASLAAAAAADRSWRPSRIVRPFPVAPVVAACIAVHLLAAAAIYHDLARDLYALFDATPRLLVLERGLTRLTAASVFLPPIIPTTLVTIVALWLGAGRRQNAVARWLALALVPLAADGVLRAVGVLVAPPPANIGELLDLPTRFSPGPRLLLDLIGIRPSPNVMYWTVVATIAAAVSAWCVARALLAAEDEERAGVGRRRRGHTAIDTVQVGVAVTGCWIALAFAGQVALPWATQLFLKAFG